MSDWISKIRGKTVFSACHGRGRLGRAAWVAGLAFVGSAFSQTHVLEKVISTGPWVITSGNALKEYALQDLGISQGQIVALSAIIQDDDRMWKPAAIMPNAFVNITSFHGGSIEAGYDPAISKWMVRLYAGGYRADTYPAKYDDPTINRAIITIRYLSSSQPAGMPQDNTLYFRLGGWDPVSLDDKGFAIPGLPVSTGSVTEFASVIYSNPVNGAVEVDKFVRSSGTHTSRLRDRGGNESLRSDKTIRMDTYPISQRAASAPLPGEGRFRTSGYRGTGYNRGWSMVRYGGTPGTSTLSQPYAVLTKAIQMGGWDMSNATAPLQLTLSNHGIVADRVVTYQALKISDYDNAATDAIYSDYHAYRSNGGGGTSISGIDNKIYFHLNIFGKGMSSTANNRGYISISHRAADCSDVDGTALPSSFNVGSRKVPAIRWNQASLSHYTDTGYEGCNGYRNGIYVIENTGDNIWTNAGQFDAFRFVYKGGSGDRTMTVKVDQLENTNGWARAGIMIRTGTANNARYAGVFATPGNGLIFQARTSPGGGNTEIGKVAGIKAPVWLKLYYAHGAPAVYAYYSLDGVSYTGIGSHLGIGMSFGGYNMGLAAASRSGYPNTSVYSGLAVQPAL